jgi:hypothetical protein
MTKEQLGELAEALSILSAKSSIVKERDELKQLMSDNIASEEVSWHQAVSLCLCCLPADRSSLFFLVPCRNPNSNPSKRKPPRSR